MKTDYGQRGALVAIAMFMLAGVAAVGASLAKMQVSGVDVTAQYTGGNKSFNVAETAFQVGLKQFKDAECDPGAVTGAAPEAADGSTTVAQSLGEMGSYKLTFCPMDGTCYPADLLPSDNDVAQAEEDDDDAKGTKHGHWQSNHGKHGKWLEWVTGKKHFRTHHKHHGDKRHHWRLVRNHLKYCHGPRNRNHHNHDPKCEHGGTQSVDDSVSYWLVTAVDNASSKQRTLQQLVSCDPGESSAGNLFTGANQAAWDPQGMIFDKANGSVRFGYASGHHGHAYGHDDDDDDHRGFRGFSHHGNDGDRSIGADGEEVILPDDEGQDVWFRGTFKLPASSGDSFQITFDIRNEGYRKHGHGKRTIQCGDSADVEEGIDLAKASQTIKCTQTGAASVTTKCDGTVDPACKISEGRLHFNLGKFDTGKIHEIQVDGKSTELYNAYIGPQSGGDPAAVKPKLEVGQWGENL